MKLRVWRVEGSNKDDPKSWGTNLNLEVVTFTLPEALAAAQAKYPDATWFKVTAGRWVSEVLVP